MNAAQLAEIVKKANDDYAAASQTRVIGYGGGMTTIMGQDIAGMQAAVQRRNDAVAAYNASQASVSSPTASPTSAPSVAPTPNLPQFIPMTNNNTIIKQAPKDTIVFDESTLDPALLQELLYQDISSMELANISREDLIDGQTVFYTPIVNLAKIKKQYDPNNIIAVGSSANSYFSRFGIDLNLRGMNEPYLDDDGNMVIEIDTIEEDENIEVEILATGTINEVDI
jgi:hypothetical protein